MKTICFLFVMVVGVTRLTANQPRLYDRSPLNITDRSPQTQIFPAEYLVKMTKQEQQMEEVNHRLGGIEKSIGDMQGDVKILMETNHVVSFLVKVAGIFIPGMFLTAFGFWLKNYYENKPKPKPA
jgi:hypothetical protein